MIKRLITVSLAMFLVFVFSPSYSADQAMGPEMIRARQMMKNTPAARKMGVQQSAGWQAVGTWPICGAFLTPAMMGHGQGVMQAGMIGNMMQPGMVNPGMMGNAKGSGGVMMGQGVQGSVPSMQGLLTKEGVRILMEYKLHFFVRNPNLKLGKITEVESGFEVRVVTRDDSLVNRFIINRYTGMMTSAN